ncbi:MAG: glycosyltransferase [Thermoanaerobaculia bacterium]|nr:glycosyltransferase [Thermoanaerobaculia bacterium]
MSPALDPDVSIVIPTLNPGPQFEELLRRLRDQEFSGIVEVLVVDSGSTDGALDVLEAHSIRTLHIDKADFNHGLTRNLAVSESRGRIVVLTVQDALPYDTRWLTSLVDCFDDPNVAGAYSCQLPRPTANPFIRDRLRNWVASDPRRRVQRMGSFDEFEELSPLEKLSQVAFDNVSSAVRRSVVERIPFRRRQFGEDLDWGLRAITSGHTIVFEPKSKVVHSHDNSAWYEFKRVYLDHQNLFRLLRVRTIPTIQDLKVAIDHECRRLRAVMQSDPLLEESQRRVWKRKALVYGASQNIAQYLGAWSAIGLEKRSPFFRHLDTILRRGV